MQLWAMLVIMVTHKTATSVTQNDWFGHYLHSSHKHKVEMDKISSSEHALTKNTYTHERWRFKI